MRIAQFLSTAAAAFTITAALAAHAQEPAAPAPFTWTGSYVGMNGGDAYHATTRFDQTTGSLANNVSTLNLGLRPERHAVRTDGFIGGLQIGYNHEFGGAFGPGAMGLGAAGVVAGLEADADYTDTRQTDTLSNTTNYGPLDVPGATPTTRVNQYQGDLNFLGTVRGRLGLAFDRTLLYGTGGFAYGDVTRRVTFDGPNAPGVPYFAGEDDGLKGGYTYGGGIEFAVPTHSMFDSLNVLHASAVTLKAEYLHYDLGDETLAIPGVNGGAALGGYTARVRTRGDLARVGINYKF